MKIHIVDQAEDDLVDGYNFYEDQTPGLGAYFLDCIYSDVESLVLYVGIHRIVHKNYRRMLSERFPFAIYYTVSGDEIKIQGRITNSEYQQLAGVIRKTAARDLDGLVKKGILARLGFKRGAHYVLARKK